MALLRREVGEQTKHACPSSEGPTHTFVLTNLVAMQHSSHGLSNGVFGILRLINELLNTHRGSYIARPSLTRWAFHRPRSRVRKLCPEVTVSSLVLNCRNAPMDLDVKARPRTEQPTRTFLVFHFCCNPLANAVANEQKYEKHGGTNQDQTDDHCFSYTKRVSQDRRQRSRRLPAKAPEDKGLCT